MLETNAYTRYVWRLFGYTFIPLFAGGLLAVFQRIGFIPVLVFAFFLLVGFARVSLVFGFSLT